MTPQALEQYLHEHIPLSAAMQTRVIAATPECVLLSAPLAPNINHRNTAFGGSVSTLATLSAWSLLRVKLAAENIGTRLVIQRNTMDYTRAITGEFIAKASSPSATVWNTFIRMLQRKGRARITVTATLWQGDQQAGQFSGEFVALGTE